MVLCPGLNLLKQRHPGTGKVNRFIPRNTTVNATPHNTGHAWHATTSQAAQDNTAPRKTIQHAMQHNTIRENKTPSQATQPNNTPPPRHTISRHTTNSQIHAPPPHTASPKPCHANTSWKAPRHTLTGAPHYNTRNHTTVTKHTKPPYQDTTHDIPHRATPPHAAPRHASDILFYSGPEIMLVHCAGAIR